MVSGWFIKRDQVPAEPTIKALSSIFKEAQGPWPDSGKDASIVKQCSQQLENISVRVHEIRDLPPVPKIGQHILIGAAFYSVYDLELLDSVITALRNREPLDERLEIFVLSCKNQADFEALMPGIGKVFQTPVVGLWKDGVLQDKASGRRAVEAIKRHYRLA